MEALAASIRPRRWTRLLLTIAVLLGLAGLEVVLAEYFWGDRRQHGLSRVFNLDAENNAPTWFSSICLFLCALLLWLTGKAARLRRDPASRYWFGIAAVFLMMSLDETASLHERLLQPMRAAFHLSGYFYYGWVVPGGLFVLAFAAATIRFLQRLPADTRRRFLVAGFTFVAGGLGIEMLAANYEFVHGEGGLPLHLLSVAEETLEMLGTVLFLRALLLHLERTLSPARTCSDDAPVA
jgi:hypothetical protein